MPRVTQLASSRTQVRTCYSCHLTTLGQLACLANGNDLGRNWQVPNSARHSVSFSPPLLKLYPLGPCAPHQSWRLSQQAFLLYGMTPIFTSEALIPIGNLLPIQTEQADQKAFVFSPLFTEPHFGGLSPSDITPGLMPGKSFLPEL